MDSFQQPLITNKNIREFVVRWATKKSNLPPIGDWDVSSVTDMSYLFNRLYYLNIARNPDITMARHFKNKNNVVKSARKINKILDNIQNFNEDISRWNVSNVKNMSHMFETAMEFNQPLANWDVSNVSKMTSMFQFTGAFNQPLAEWDVRKVKDMNLMFYGAKAFNQPINNWNVSDKDCDFMFDGSIVSEENRASGYNYILHGSTVFAREVAPISDGKKPRLPASITAEILQYLGLTREHAIKIAEDGEINSVQRLIEKAEEYKAAKAEAEEEDGAAAKAVAKAIAEEADEEADEDAEEDGAVAKAAAKQADEEEEPKGGTIKTNKRKTNRRKRRKRITNRRKTNKRKTNRRR